MKKKVDLDSSSSYVKKIQNMFGITNSERIIYDDVNLDLIKDAQITCISGPSGSGKSLIGRTIEKRYGYSKVPLKVENEIPIIESLNVPFEKSLYYLNMVGLSEAYLYLTPYENLSTGQQFRYYLAQILLSGVSKVLIDEFTSFLDRDTAQIVSYNLQKVIRKSELSIVVITTNDDLEKYLQPDVHVKLNEFSKISIIKNNHDGGNYPFSSDIEVVNGSYDDIIPFEQYHYFDNPTCDTLERYGGKYYCLKYKNKILGVAVTSYPYPNNVSEVSLKNINSNLRKISRIIIHPQIRGIGATKLLFLKILQNEKKVIFVRSAMSLYHPFLNKLNMKENHYHYFGNDSDFIQTMQSLNSKSHKAWQKGVNYLSKLMYKDYINYCTIIGSPVLINQSFFLNVAEDTFYVDDIELIKDVIYPINMKEYFYDNRKGNL
ncbi:hypothetical protein [Bombilactobacillus thymidiniphilus]|uniref:AAA+ ATPase domain-containing protein n=1 Tax=Bombilactobacillus thymidiniphilus TaxID=2923363 RepID=A0ABY4PEJ4_9LACO|nr:hypothetical protein [Bombilactobacillus thymidiniphilus]UQS83962.1 hypothetical protein MOO47_01885 [Bombilactobacillus thymidiniphilus]